MEPIHWILLGLATFLLTVWIPVLRENCRRKKR